MRDQATDSQMQKCVVREVLIGGHSGSIVRYRHRTMMVIDMARRSLGRTLLLIAIVLYFGVAFEIDHLNGMTSRSRIGERRAHL